jgi:hypothetical protein
VSSRNAWYTILAGWLGLVLVSGVLTGLSSAAATFSSAPLEAVERPYDPLIVFGDQLDVQLVPQIDELALYRYRGAVWSAIPFQVDEIDLTGTLVITGDGVLDPQDELVWMAWDGGEQAPPSD